MIKKHKTTRNYIEAVLPDATVNVGEAKLNRMFTEGMDRHLTLVDRKQRFHLIQKAKVEAERRHKFLEEAWRNAMQDVTDNGGTLR